MNEATLPKGVERVFKLTPPDGEPFLAAVINVDGERRVISNRRGEWAPDWIEVADLVMPEQKMGEWDVEEVKGPNK